MPSEAPSRSTDPEPRLEFRILVDRFGFRFDAEANRDDGWMQAILEEWERTVSSLFGDVDKALRIAGEAGVLDSYPAWPETAEALDRLKMRAKAQQPPAPPHSLTDNTGIDITTRSDRDQLYQYVAMLASWAVNFQLGTCAALYAGRWAVDEDERRRNVIGLQSIASVYGNVEAADQNEMFSRLSALLAPISEKSDGPPDYGWWSRSSWMTAGRGDFSEDAGPRLLDWLKSFCDELSSPERGRSRLSASATEIPVSGSVRPGFDLETAYWDQWYWTSSGPLRTTDATMFDLMHASRHGGFSMLPLRGGNLSIGQLCRIMAHFQMGPDRRTDVANRVVGTVSNILGFPELGTVNVIDRVNIDNRSSEASRDAELVVVISLQSSKSPGWLWRPEAGVRALVPVPPDLAAVDQIATANWPEKVRLDAVITLLKESLVSRPARVFHFIETRTGDADWPFASQAVLPFDIRVETFSFGSGGENRQEFMRHINQRVMSVSGLLVAARRQYADAFPLPESQRRNPWLRLRHDARQYFTRVRRNSIRLVSRTRSWFEK